MMGRAWWEGMGVLMTDGGQSLMTISHYMEMRHGVCTAAFPVVTHCVLLRSIRIKLGGICAMS